MENVEEAIHYIESKANKKTFEAYQEILNKHHIHLNTKRIIHVTGTNGKGSTVHYMAHGLMKLGYQVGTFTSPYLISYHDRFCVNGQPIDDLTLMRIVQENYTLIEEEKLSKFEIDVLIMIQYFNSLPLDFAIVEVGVGGKEDKTNVVDSTTQIIVNIGHDHMPRLGTTELEVCQQKAGIIKEDSTVYTCVTQEDCLAYIEQVCQQKHCKLERVVREIPLNYRNLAYYQHLNISLAYHVLMGLDVGMNLSIMQSVVDTTFWNGRFEIFYDGGTKVIIDGAHNQDGIQALLDSLAYAGGDYTVIFSALRDKDYPLMIKMLSQKYPVFVTVFEDERKMTFEDLSQFEYVYPEFSLAYQEAKKRGNIVITGSLHFISYVRKILIEMTSDKNGE